MNDPKIERLERILRAVLETLIQDESSLWSMVDNELQSEIVEFMNNG